MVKNKKAQYNYEFLEEYVAGIVLKGSEIKSIRSNNVNIFESYCIFIDNELYVKNMHITPYKNMDGFDKSIDSMRDRKLLLNKSELRKLSQKVSQKGLTIIPVELFISKNGYAKVSIVLARGKHSYDKKQTLKERDIDRDMKNQ